MYRLLTAILALLIVLGVRPGFAVVIDAPVLTPAQTETPAEPGEEEGEEPGTQEDEEEEPDCD